MKFWRISLATVVILLLCGMVYFKQYLPSFAATHTALSSKKIAQLKQVTPVTSIEVFKSQRILLLKNQQRVIRSYPIRLGFNPLGHKQFEGDGKTPEGVYTIDWRNPNSAFYKSLHISYPNQNDQNFAQQQGQSAGGNVMIHGSVPKQLLFLPWSAQYIPRKDWTLGCIAVSNVDMNEIWQLIPDQTKIIIHP